MKEKSFWANKVCPHNFDQTKFKGIEIWRKMKLRYSFYFVNRKLECSITLVPWPGGGSPVDSYSSDSSNVSPTETRQTSPAQPPFMSPPPPPTAGAHNLIRSQKKLSPNSENSSPRSATDIESGKMIRIMQSHLVVFGKALLIPTRWCKVFSAIELQEF